MTLIGSYSILGKKLHLICLWWSDKRQTRILGGHFYLISSRQRNICQIFKLESSLFVSFSQAWIALTKVERKCEISQLYCWYCVYLKLLIRICPRPSAVIFAVLHQQQHWTIRGSAESYYTTRITSNYKFSFFLPKSWNPDIWSNLPRPTLYPSLRSVTNV